MSSGCQRAFVSLYRELGKIGVTAASVARCKVWEVAAMLGVGWQTDDEAPAASGASSRSSLDIIRQRIEAEQTGGPPPEAATPTPEEIAEMQAAFAMPSM